MTPAWRIGRRELCQLGLGWAAVLLAPAVTAQTRLRGRVINAVTGAGLSRVGVSNGFDIVDTGGDGRFEIAVADDLPFIFVNPPSGMTAVPQYFRGQGDGALEFRLTPIAGRGQSRLRIAHVTDSHIGVPHYPHYVSPSELADDVRRVSLEATPDLIVVTGDLVDQGRRADLEAYRDAVAAAGTVPVVSLFAGHDGLEESRSAQAAAIVGQDFRAVLGPQWFSFDWGIWHFVLFPEINAEPPARRNRRRLDRWIEIDLARLPSDRLIAVLTHDPPRWHPDVGTYFTGPRIEQFAAHGGLRLVLHGQYHSTRALKVGPVTVVGTPPIGMGGIDTSPRGYALVELDEAGVQSVEYRTLAAPQPRRPAARQAPVRGGWEMRLPAGVHRSAPAATESAFVFCLADRPNPFATGLVALNAATGKLRWRLSTDSTIKAGVAIAPTDHPRAAGRGFAASVAGRLICLEAESGREVWTRDLPNYPDRWIFSLPLLTKDAAIVAQYSGLTAFDVASGDLLWKDGPQWEDGWSPVYQTPALAGGLLIYLITKSLGNYAVCARRADSGELVWMRRLDRPPSPQRPRLYQLHYPSPVVTRDSVIVSGLAERLVALDIVTGDTRWDTAPLRFEGDAAGVQPGGYLSVFEHPAGVYTAGDVAYVSMSNGRVAAVALDDGRRLWGFSSTRAPLADVLPYFRGRGNLLTSPAVEGDRVVVGGADGVVYTLNRATGVLMDEEDLGEAITAPPLVTRDGTLVATVDGRVMWRPHAAVRPGGITPQKDGSR